eukprot:2545494-Ditylum_brightwellii.AAC.1
MERAAPLTSKKNKNNGKNTASKVEGSSDAMGPGGLVGLLGQRLNTHLDQTQVECVSFAEENIKIQVGLFSNSSYICHITSRSASCASIESLYRKKDYDDVEDHHEDGSLSEDSITSGECLQDPNDFKLLLYLVQEVAEGKNDFFVNNIIEEENNILDCNFDIDGEQVEELHNSYVLSKEIKL